MKNQSRTANVKIKSKPSSIQSSKQDPNVTVHKIQISSSQMGAKMGLKKLWNIVPLFIKFMSLSTLTLCILNLFLKNISYLLSNIPLNTIFHLSNFFLISLGYNSNFFESSYSIIIPLNLCNLSIST